MAGDDDGDTVVSIGSANGAYGVGVVYFAGDIGVTAGFTVRYGLKSIPNRFLENGSRGL